MFTGGWWVTRVLENEGPVFLAARCIWVIMSITLHELAHGWMAIRKGDRTPIDSGHMTFNPVVHMGVQSLLIFAVAGIAWGAMPVDPTRLRGRYAEAWVAFAGPLMNFMLAALSICAAGAIVALTGKWISRNNPDIAEGLIAFFIVGGYFNIALGLFNLLPIYPMDGGRILGNIYRPFERFSTTEAGQFISMACYVIAFFFSGFLIYRIGIELTVQGVRAIVALHSMLIGSPATP